MNLFIRNFYYLLLSFLFLTNIEASDLLKEKITSIPARKRGHFFDQAILHTKGQAKGESKIIRVRSHYHQKKREERLVFEFQETMVPEIYSRVNSSERRLNIDFFKTTRSKEIQDHLKNVKYLDKLRFYDLNDGVLSVEMLFDKSLSFDIFYLTNPGRLVIDIK